MSAIPDQGFLTLRVGGFGRTIRATSGGGVRGINIGGCRVIRWHVMSRDMKEHKLCGRSFSREELIDLSIGEANGLPLWDDPEQIGALSTNHVNLYVAPNAFELFWTAAAATDGSDRTLELVLKAGDHEVLAVTNVGLIETMPAPDEGDTSRRLHPVVSEIRDMREGFRATAKFLIIMVWIVTGVLLVWKLFSVE